MGDLAAPRSREHQQLHASASGTADLLAGRPQPAELIIAEHAIARRLLARQLDPHTGRSRNDATLAQPAEKPAHRRPSPIGHNRPVSRDTIEEIDHVPAADLVNAAASPRRQDNPGKDRGSRAPGIAPGITLGMSLQELGGEPLDGIESTTGNHNSGLGGT